jgi:hypothetical protein
MQNWRNIFAIAIALAGCSPAPPSTGNDSDVLAPRTGPINETQKAPMVVESNATAFQLADGSHVYVLQLNLGLTETICVSEVALAEGVFSQGAFVRGRNAQGVEFSFFDVLSRESVVRGTIPIEVESSFIEVSFRSNMEARSLKSSIPYSFCEGDREIDWDLEGTRFLTSDWVDVDF